MDGKIEKRFWDRVNKTDGCWKWTASKNLRGYGQLTFGSRTDKSRNTVSAHRLSWMINVGDIPSKMCVLHKCDNPPCVRPEHLYVGTHQDNMRDRDSKGRNAQVAGEQHGAAKLTEEQVKEIRSQYIPGVISQSMLAAHYGVSREAISFIVNRVNWKHI